MIFQIVELYARGVMLLSLEGDKVLEKNRFQAKKL